MALGAPPEVTRVQMRAAHANFAPMGHFASSPTRALGLGLAGVILAAPSMAAAVDLMTSYRWDIDEFSSGELQDGTSDAYDGCYNLEVDGVRYEAGGTYTESPDGRTITLGSATIGSLEVQRIVYVPASGGDWARYLEVLTNPTASEVRADVRIFGNLGSDFGTTVFASSSGDTAVSTADAWFSTDDTDGSGDPSLAHVFQGDPASSPTSPATAASITRDDLEYSYAVTVPPGGRVAILSFALQGASQAAVQAEAARLIELPDDAVEGLDDYASDIVNFSLASFTEPCVGVPERGACTTPRGDAGSCRSGSCCAGCWNGTRCVSGRSPAACGLRGANCAACADTDPCTSDECTEAGTCSYPDAPRGTFCDDGVFCTAADRCDGAGNCTGSGDRCDDGLSCTTDTCDEAMRACVSAPPSDQCIIGRACVPRGSSPPGSTCLVCDPTRNPRGWVSTGGVCAIGGVCVTPGTRNASYPCLVCDPARNANDWSSVAAGESCGDAFCSGGRVVTAATCSSTGVCMPGAATACAAGYCASETECASMCAEGDCPPGTYCAASGACERRRANGSSCDDDGDCGSGQCVDRICCSEECTGECRSCIVPGRVGTCIDVPAMTDPDGECGPGGFCDASGACTSGSDAGPTTPDAGPIDAGSIDAGSSAAPDAARFIDTGVTLPDAGPPRAAGGCSVARRGPSAWVWLGLALAGLAATRRRRGVS
ncbi:MAG: hypothetical protein ACK5U8_23340 [Deltaproteobacteria bacterium]|jgi:hypothetical protein